MNRAAVKWTGPADILLPDTSVTEPLASWFSPMSCFCFNLNDSWLMWGTIHVTDCNLYLLSCCFFHFIYLMIVFFTAASYCFLCLLYIFLRRALTTDIVAPISVSPTFPTCVDFTVNGAVHINNQYGSIYIGSRLEVEYVSLSSSTVFVFHAFSG